MRTTSTQISFERTRLIRAAVAVLASVGVLAALTVPASAGPPLVGGGVTTGPASRAGSANTWVPTGSMSVSRSGQTATLLPDGMVLVAGGGTARAELYDPASGTFTPTGSMTAPRTDATATLLADGNVLVAGGCCDGRAQLSSAELYDPGTGTWSATGSMNVARSSHTATLLPDGDVLVAGGGCNGHGFGCDSASYLGTLRSAELYDPATGLWTRTGRMADGREFFTATLLGDGRVLAAGGFNNCDDSLCQDLKSAEVYDPATGRWSETGTMAKEREQHTASLLPDGRVLVAGGLNAPGNGGRSFSLAEAETYDPTTGLWSRVASMSNARYGGTSTVLRNGWVLVAGGTTRTDQIFEPRRGIWATPGLMNTVRTDQTATLLADGHVLVTGGKGPDGRAQPTAEVYLAGMGPLVALQPASVRFGGQHVGSTSTARTLTVVNDGTGDLNVDGVSVSGADPGDFTVTTSCGDAPVPPSGTCQVSVRFSPSAIGLRTAEVGIVDDAPRSPQRAEVEGFGKGSYVWVPTGAIQGARDEATATLLGDGTVLVAGGEDFPTEPLDTAALYDPATGRFGPTGSLDIARSYATATRLRNGEVLVAGGEGANFERLSSAELYDPATGAWTLTGAMHQGGYGLTSTLLPNGKVLVTGLGSPGAEVYNPATGTWKDTGAMVGNGTFSAATLLPDGQVLVVGGQTDVTELYDPATNAWTATGSLHVSRSRPTATLMQNGQVLVAGGDGPNGEPLASSELYDPATGVWTLTNGSMQTPRFGHTATLLPNGWVLVAGGCSQTCSQHSVTASSEVYDADSGYWFGGSLTMNQARFAATATLLRNGSLLVVGGSNYCCRFYASAETFEVPILTDRPSSGPVGTRVRLHGSGYYAFETVRLTWDGQPLARTRTTKNGAFVLEVTVPAGSAGKHTILAVGRTSFVRAQATFTVTVTASG